MHEVARLAGVSHQTVSRYFRETGGMRPETRKKIDTAVEALAYRPNLVARSMRTRRTERLAVVLPATHYFPLRLLGAASATAHEAGYRLEVVSVEGDLVTRTRRVREIAGSGHVEGVLSLAPLEAGEEERGQVPVVVTGDYDDHMRGLGALADGSTVDEIVGYLAGLGHRTFLHVAGAQSFASARERRRVYLEAVERRGLRSYGVVDGDWSARSGHDAIAELPEDCGVTAVVAANDVIAMGVVRGALARGWRVPRDLSVFGWDDDEIARFATPSLSTVAVDRESQGREAIARLIGAIRGEAVPLLRTRAINRLVPRESTAPPGRDS